MRNSAVCLLEAAYRRRPQGAALEDEAQCLTYEALRESARRVGAGLLRHSQSSAPVMVYLPKSVGMVQGFYGTLYAGRAYVPTDSAAPKARLGRILSNLRPSAVITNETLKQNLEGLRRHRRGSHLHHVHVRLHRRAEGRDNPAPGRAALRGLGCRDVSLG